MNSLKEKLLSSTWILTVFTRKEEVSKFNRRFEEVLRSFSAESNSKPITH